MNARTDTVVIEIAAILAAGYLRLQEGNMLTHAADNPNDTSESGRPGLDFSAETRLSVPAG